MCGPYLVSYYVCVNAFKACVQGTFLGLFRLFTYLTLFLKNNNIYIIFLDFSL